MKNNEPLTLSGVEEMPHKNAPSKLLLPGHFCYSLFSAQTILILLCLGVFVGHVYGFIFTTTLTHIKQKKIIFNMAFYLIHISI